MVYIILDLEATCWENKTQKPNEIIEIGALAFDEKANFLGDFQRFVKPTVYPMLSDFCKNLTTIKQDEIDAAEKFPVVLADFLAWINNFSPKYTLGSWGQYDKNQFIADCKLHQLSFEWTNLHINLKEQYAKIKKMPKAIGMDSALRYENLCLEGTHHRGIDDARNISQIFILFFDKWHI